MGAAITAVGLVASLVLAASPTEGGSVRVAVAPLVTGPTSLSALFEAVADEAERRVGLRTIYLEELFTGQETLRRIRNCGADERCLARQFEALGAGLGVIVTVVSAEQSPALVSIQLVDVATRQTLGDRVEEYSPERDQSIPILVARMMAKLLDDAGYLPEGKLVVSVTPANAVIRIEGRAPDTGTPNQYTLPPGRYEVLAESDGFEPTRQTVAVESGLTQTVVLELSEDSSIFESPWLWVGLGVLAVGGATAAVIATQPQDRCVCLTLQGAGCGCD